MKKRKPPIILGSILATLFGGLLVFGAMQSKPPTPGGDGHNHDANQVTGESTSAPSAKDLHTGAVANAGGPKGRPKEEEDSEGAPSILEPDFTEFKPTPSDSSTSAHWYDKGSQHSGN